MKKSFSKSVVFIVAVVLILAGYCVLYMVPAQNELIQLRAETTVANAEASIYRQYLNDLSPLEADIASIQKEIDSLHADGYVNDSNVSFEIGNAIQRYNISLSSVTLDNVTTFEGHRALPINVTMTGELDNILKFISHFENNPEGSYLVRGSSIEISGYTTKASVSIFLCTPDM